MRACNNWPKTVTIPLTLSSKVLVQGNHTTEQ